MFHQLEGLAIDEDITLADLQGVLLAFARQMFGERHRGAAAPGLLPVHRAERRGATSPASAAAAPATRATQRCSTCKGEGWIEILGSGMVDPNVLDFVAENGYDQERVQGFAFGMGIERIAMLVHGVPDLRMLFENDAAPRWSSSAHEGPVRMAARVLRPGRAGRGDRRHAHDGRRSRSSALHRVGVGDPAEFVVGRVLTAERHPDADRLTRVHGRRRRRRAEHDRLRRAQRGRRPDGGGGAARARSCPTARSSARRSCAASSRAG